MDFDWSKLDLVQQLISESGGSNSEVAQEALCDLRAEILSLTETWQHTSDAQAEAVVTAAMQSSELTITKERLSAEIATRKRAEATIQSLIRLTSTATGTSYFERLCSGLAQALNPEVVLVARTDGVCATTLAVWRRGMIETGFSYDLAGTPCHEVYEGTTCAHKSDVQALFPEDVMLQEMGIESYLGVPLRGPDGAILGLIIMLDLEPRDDLEEATEIVELFAHRAAVELVRLETDTRLIEAKRTAEEASRTKSSFLAMISHEIRTPLNGILGLTSVLLLDESLSAEHRALVDTTHSSGQVLLRVLNDVLDFSKIEAGELKIVEGAFRPEQLVEDVLALYDHGAASKVISCVAWAESDVPTIVVADDTRVRQVLGNLIGNATKFTSDGEILVVVRLGEDGDTLEFEVSDTGIGIEESAQRKIFEPFSQADGSMARQYGGTGLGLSICRQLVEKMGGEIGVRSEVGVGSTFWFRIPLVVPEQPDDSARPSRLHVHAAVASPATEAALSARLARLGVETTIVGSLDELVLALQADRPRPSDLSRRAFVVDLDLVTDSVEQLRAILEESGREPVIALGSSAAWWNHRASRQAFSGLLTRPMRSGQIETVLRGLLPEQPTEAPVRTCGSGGELAKPLCGRVLLVEDNPVNCVVAQRMLEKVGCDVVTACDGSEALSILESRSFDVILMDCQMPVMDGFEATGKIRAMQRGHTARTPIIAMTANAMEGDRGRCLTAGMDDYIAKPVDILKLRSALEHWMDPPTRGHCRPATTR